MKISYICNSHLCKPVQNGATQALASTRVSIIWFCVGPSWPGASTTQPLPHGKKSACRAHNHLYIGEQTQRIYEDCSVQFIWRETTMLCIFIFRLVFVCAATTEPKKNSNHPKFRISFFYGKTCAGMVFLSTHDILVINPFWILFQINKKGGTMQHYHHHQHHFLCTVINRSLQQ